MRRTNTGLAKPPGGAFGLSVAASNSSSQDKATANYVGTGTADNVQLQAALDLIAANGGGLLSLAAGTYYIANGLLVTTNVRILISGYGATFLLTGAGVVAITVQQGVVAAVGVRIQGLIIDGQSNGATTGIEFTDTNNSESVDVRISNCTTGIRLSSVVASKFVEGSLIDSTIITGCTNGITTVVVSGTGSFAQTVIRNVKITTTVNGLLIGSNSILQRSFIQLTCWVGDGQIAVWLDGNVEDTTFQLGIEGLTGSTTNIGLLVSATCTNTDQAFMYLLFTGTLATQANFNSRNVNYWAGGSQIVQSAGTAFLSYKRHGDSTDRLRFEGLTNGGRIQFGNGALLDVNLYRTAADVLASDDQFRSASLGVQVKAGTPVDGDIVGGAVSGNIVVDTTASKIWVRVGATWKGVVVA